MRLLLTLACTLVTSTAYGDEFHDLLSRTEAIRKLVHEDSSLSITKGYCHVGAGNAIRSMNPCTRTRDEFCNVEIGECGFIEVYTSDDRRIMSINGEHDPVSEEFGLLQQKGDCMEPFERDGRLFCFTRTPELQRD